MRRFAIAALAVTLMAGAARADAPPAAPRDADPPSDLAAPAVLLDGSAINRRLFPAFSDIDGDGFADLLVGIPNRLLVYRNRGTNERPAYDADPAWLDETVPTARIPDG